MGVAKEKKGEEGEGGMVKKKTETVKNKLSRVGKTMGEKVHDDGGCSNMGDPCKKLVRKCRSNVNDVKWARRGVVATVKNGEVILVVQTMIADAEFQNLHIIPLGADKVFIHSLSAEDVMINFNVA
ncbi:sulfate transporter [Trifolium medium]|uniref:Sulfate transporter n=1 Tax=Trifolium medium TaxID=97028 RepID=A0A392P170_9FABA|nr:sulfate transporter [Trifolium medium]